MGNKESQPSNEDKSNDHCFITKDGDHVSVEEIFEAGAAVARLEDTESPGPIGDAINTLLQGDINWNAAPENIEGPCSDH